jgi:hypothetical protein
MRTGQAAIVEDQYLDRQALLHRGGQFRHQHGKPAVGHQTENVRCPPGDQGFNEDVGGRLVSAGALRWLGRLGKKPLGRIAPGLKCSALTFGSAFVTLRP